MPENLFEQKMPLTIAVVGLGKIGLPLAVQYARHGHRVTGCDINPQVVASVNRGISHVQEEVELASELPRLVDAGLIQATLDTTAAARQADVVVVVVPVLNNAKHEIDFTHIDEATLSIGAGLRHDSLVIYETTVPVGTTAHRFRQLLERASGLSSGRDFTLAYSPERVSSGSIFRDLRIYPKIVGGIDAASTANAVAFYGAVLDAEIITMASANDAEFVKLIETTYRDVNIALANEYARYADTRGLDVVAAIAAANTQPYSHIHDPGVGVGGHCIPVYPYFLFANAEDGSAQEFASRQHLQLPRSARGINDSMADYAIQRIESTTGSLAARSVLILGVAYRGNVRETAFSSAKLLQEALLERNAHVYAHDPLFSENELHSLGYEPLVPELEKQVEVIILQSNHRIYQTFDFTRFPQCRVVLDGRRALHRATIEALNIMYISIGDGRQTQKAKADSDNLSLHI